MAPRQRPKNTRTPLSPDEREGSLYKRGKQWWTAFVEDGVLYRKPLNTENRREAVKRERQVDAAKQGSLTAKITGPKTLFTAVERYIEHKRSFAKSARTPDLETERLNVVKAHFKDVNLTAITASAIEHTKKRGLRQANPIAPSTWTWRCSAACSRISRDGVRSLSTSKCCRNRHRS